MDSNSILTGADLLDCYFHVQPLGLAVFDTNLLMCLIDSFLQT